MSILPIIKTERLILRNIAMGDVDDMYEYARTSLVGPTAGWKPHGSTYETKSVIASFLGNQARGDLGVWSIVVKETGKMIGTIELYNYVPKFFAELGYSLNPSYWGKGYATEAAKAVVDYGFNVLRLRRIEAGTFETNKQSIRVCEKVGFTKEGILKNSYLRELAKTVQKIILLLFYNTLVYILSTYRKNLVLKIA